MRTIKFRGKDNHNEWIYGSLIQFGKEQPKIEFVKRTHLSDNRVLETDWAYVHEETVGQFTGLFDKNGSEIYEGDIVKFTKWNGKFVTGFVKWDDCNPCMCIEFKTEYKHTDWEFDFIKCGTMIIEVIGNIHDNTELFKKYN